MNMDNITQLIGYLGQNPTSKLTKNDKSYVEFSLATHDRYKNAQGKQATKTQWHTIQAYGILAKRVKAFAEKGDQVGLTGKLTYKADKATIVASEVLFLKKSAGITKISKKEEIKEAV